MIEKRVSRTSAKVVMGCGIILGIAGVIFLIVGINSLNSFFDRESGTYYVIAGILFLVSCASGMWDGLSLINILDELGVDSAMTSEIRAYKKARRLNGPRYTLNSQNQVYQNPVSQTPVSQSGFQNNPAQNMTNMQNAVNQPQNVYSQPQNVVNQPQNAYSQPQNAPYSVIQACPSCKTNMKLPGGKGQIQASCPRCNYIFYVRT